MFLVANIHYFLFKLICRFKYLYDYLLNFSLVYAYAFSSYIYLKDILMDLVDAMNPA